MKRKDVMRKKMLYFVFLTLIIAMNFLEISIPFFNTTNEVNAIYHGRAWFWNGSGPCAECRPFTDGECLFVMLPDWLPPC
jgi:hypothetical protein